MNPVRSCTARIILPIEAANFHGEAFLEFRSAKGRVTRTVHLEASDTGYARDPLVVLRSALSGRFRLVRAKQLERTPADGAWLASIVVTRVPRPPRTQAATKERARSNEARQRRYSALRREFLTANPACVRCGGAAEQVHHARGRAGENLFRHFVAVCADCHVWIHSNPVEAEKLGWLHSERILGGGRA